MTEHEPKCTCGICGRVVTSDEIQSSVDAMVAKFTKEYHKPSVDKEIAGMPLCLIVFFERGYLAEFSNMAPVDPADIGACNRFVKKLLHKAMQFKFFTEEEKHDRKAELETKK